MAIRYMKIIRTRGNKNFTIRLESCSYVGPVLYKFRERGVIAPCIPMRPDFHQLVRFREGKAVLTFNQPHSINTLSFRLDGLHGCGTVRVSVATQNSRRFYKRVPDLEAVDLRTTVQVKFEEQPVCIVSILLTLPHKEDPRVPQLEPCICHLFHVKDVVCQSAEGNCDRCVSSETEGPPRPRGSLAAYTKQALPENTKMLGVYVTHVHTPSCLCIQLIGENTTRTLEYLLEDLTQFYNSSKGDTYLLKKPQLGQPCCSIFNNDGYWYRAEVVGLPASDISEVLYVDYGNIGRLNYSICPSVIICCVWPLNTRETKVHGLPDDRVMWCAVNMKELSDPHSALGVFPVPSGELCDGAVVAKELSDPHSALGVFPVPSLTSCV